MIRFPRATRARFVWLAALGIGLVLVGSAGFGLIHVVGGIWRANPRAAWFGVGLAAASLILLAGLASFAQRVPASR